MNPLQYLIRPLFLPFLMLVCCSRSFAMMDISLVSPERAKELGMQLRVTKNGPSEAWVELEFKAEGELKNFDHVSLEIRDGEKFLLGWTALKEKRTNSGSVVVVGFLANRAYLERVTLCVVVSLGAAAPGRGVEMDGYDLRLKDFPGLASAAEARADKAAGPADKAEAEAAATTDSPRQVVAEFLRRILAEREKKIDVQEVWALTTRSTDASWGLDLINMVKDDQIHPLRQLGNEERTLVLSAPFHYQGRERVFVARLLKRDGKWLIESHDAYRSRAEAASLLEGFLLVPGVKFDVQAAELVGKWHFPCASTLTLFANGKGVEVDEGPSGLPEKPQRFRWDVSGSTLRRHWPDHTDTAAILWVTDDTFRVIGDRGQNSYFDDREAASPPESSHELVVYDPRQTGKQTHGFGIDAERQRLMDETLIPKLDVADPHQTDASLVDWTRECRLDAVGRVVLADGQVKHCGLRTFELLTISAPADSWEKATAAQVSAQIRARLEEWSFIGQVNDLLSDGKTPGTFIFRTREGAEGLLQILGSVEKGGVKIRYKVTKEGT